MDVTHRLPGRAPGLALALLVAACAPDPGPTPGLPSAGFLSPAPSSGPPQASPAPAATAGAGGSPLETAGRPDLAAAAVTLEVVADGLDQPVFVTGAGDGSGRLFIAEQPGRIRVLGPGSTAAAPFLDIADRVTAGGERGLLGLALAPGFGRDDPRAFVHYSGEDGATVVSRFRLDAHDISRLDPASEQVVLTEPQPFANHNGGWIGFDRDETLLVALGDGGAGGDPGNRAADPGQVLGKILRLEVLAPPDGAAYGIPADNPFAAGGGRPEILHLGLRNPFRSWVDPSTGDLWIGDVGQDAWEEIDVARAGARGLDFGWRRFEGRRCFDPSPAADCDATGITMPVAVYGHDAGCSVIGGVVYRGGAIPALHGAYLFADFCSGTLWAIDAAAEAGQEPVALLETGAAVSAITTGDDGEVYLADLAGGRLLRLVPAG